MDFTSVRAAVDYFLSFGIYAPLAVFILFFIQAVIPIFPYFILAGAAGLIFGFWKGAFLSWAGALCGACFFFYMVRLTKWEWLHVKLSRVFKYDLAESAPLVGFWGILLARIFPVVPTPLINFVSAVSGVSAWVFISASAIGKLPTALIYTGLGNHMLVTEDIQKTLILLGVVVLVIYGGVLVLKRRLARSRQEG